MNKNRRQQGQNNERKQARSDVWDMLNAFVTTPDISRMHFANSVGELDIVRTDRDKPTKRIGFTTDAIGTDYGNADDTDDDSDDEYSDDEYSDTIKKFVRWFD